MNSTDGQATSYRYGKLISRHLTPGKNSLFELCGYYDKKYYAFYFPGLPGCPNNKQELKNDTQAIHVRSGILGSVEP